jgi:hypothetical protein
MVPGLQTGTASHSIGSMSSQAMVAPHALT